MKDLNKAIEAMNKAVSNKEVIDIVPVKEEKKAGRPKLIDKAMEVRLIRLAEEYFFIRSIAGKAGISKDTINRYLSEKENEEFATSFLHARDKWIAFHQDLLNKYAIDKKTKDWHAIKYLLTIADKEFSERKYLTEAVANQDAKILMLIKAEQLTIAGKKGKEMLKNVDIKGEEISLLPFKEEDPKNKGKPKNVKNKGQNAPSPSVE